MLRATRKTEATCQGGSSAYSVLPIKFSPWQTETRLSASTVINVDHNQVTALIVDVHEVLVFNFD